MVRGNDDLDSMVCRHRSGTLYAAVTCASACTDAGPFVGVRQLPPVPGSGARRLARGKRYGSRRRVEVRSAREPWLVRATAAEPPKSHFRSSAARRRFALDATMAMNCA